VNSATATTFTVSGAANTNAVIYVAYLFAHDTSADGMIQCGSFTETGGTFNVELGWEPQFFMYKTISRTDDWTIVDQMRGWTQNTTGDVGSRLRANLSSAEDTGTTGYLKGPYATGVHRWTNWSAETQYIYLAIRRPNKPPTSGTQVYNAIARTGTDVAGAETQVGLAADLVLNKVRNPSGNNWPVLNRLRGNTLALRSNTTDSELTVGNFGFNGPNNNSYYWPANGGDYNTGTVAYISYFFRRAPGFFDVVCDTGTGSAHTVSHNLGVVPELMIRKKRSAADNWIVYAGDATDYLILNSTAATADLDTMWNDTSPTASVFTVGTDDDVNQSTGTFVTYLFATLAGISKVGSYTGNGSSQTINCGFAAGARFFLVKAASTTGSWWVYDSARGIVASTDFGLQLNSTAAETTSADAVDPDSSGIIVNQEATCSINANGVSYIYMAIS